MATKETSKMLYTHFGEVKIATEEKQTRWPAVYGDLVQALDMREFDGCDWNTRREVRQAVFDEQQNLLEVIRLCTELQSVRRRVLDIFKAIKTRVNFEFQTIDDFIREAKLDKYVDLFKERQLSRLLDILNVDINEFEPHMQTIPFKRLTKNIRRVRTVTEYCDSQLKDDIDKAAEEHVCGVNDIAHRLQGVISRLDARRQELRTVAKHEPSALVAYPSVFGYITTNAYNFTSSAVSLVKSKTWNTVSTVKGFWESYIWKTDKTTDSSSSEVDDTAAAVAEDDMGSFLDVTQEIEVKANPPLEHWKAAAIEESHQVKKSCYCLQSLMTKIQQQSHKDGENGDIGIALECLNDAENVFAEYLNDMEVVKEQLSQLSKRKF